MTAITGIDPGTSNSAAAVLRGGRPLLIPRIRGRRASAWEARRFRVTWR